MADNKMKEEDFLKACKLQGLTVFRLADLVKRDDEGGNKEDPANKKTEANTGGSTASTSGADQKGEKQSDKTDAK